ncbi:MULTISPECIES: hypothetical protein [Haloarcula]|uniref:Uncharacterized protein n=1 Tax=Haloarcula amylolytica JCM 13557 TaxID=1227452 RepID=M0KL93_9EURY|nr:hypothetical protein [Haloarcula amylolytica]EMA21683.1 hypothetical protein C442_09492 [Haloarcula amylolytica JCM 13557]
MTNARGPSSETLEETAGSDACVCSIGNAVEHYVTGILGLVATLVIGVQAYPWLQATAGPSYLGSTWLVFSFAAVWLVCWIALEVAWEWRAGRVHLL